VSMIYSIAEYFESIQGEGPYAGSFMLFIRLAGCNVGRYQDAEMAPALALHPRHSVCQSVLGRKFICDTDYHYADRVDLEPLLVQTRAQHVCLTGGEPLLHDLRPIVRRCLDLGKQPHVETSGTIPIPDDVFRDAFVVCSPKIGFLPENRGKVHHYKFVISREDLSNGAEDVWRRILDFLGDDAVWATVSLQPVNGLLTVDADLAVRLVDVIRQAPGWIDASLSIQMHKFVGLR